MPNLYDAIVIGAGHNGLAAAVHLASRNWRVLVVEAARQPGGAVQTREVTVPGVRHDLFAMSISLFAQSEFHAIHGEALKTHGLAFVSAPDSFASVFPDGSHLTVGTDIEKTVGAIAQLSSADALSWSAMIQDFGRKAPHIFSILGASIPSWQVAWATWKIWRSGGSALLLELARLLVSSPRAYLDRHFENQKVKTLMAAWAAHLDFAPETAGGALFPYLQSMVSQFHPMVIGQGGADTIIKSMVSLLKETGGELLVSSPVSEVLLKGRSAQGVRLADGRVFLARRAVISNVHPKLLFDSLIAKNPSMEPFVSKLAKFRMGPASMTVHLALDDLPVWAASSDLRKVAYVHVAPDMDAIDRTYQEACRGLLPAAPLLVVGQPTAFDPSRAPTGKHALWIQVRFLPSVIRGDAKDEIKSIDWDEAKEAFADRVIDIIESYAPGLKNSIRGRYVISPRDLERENANLIGGDGTAGSHHLDQNFLFRPVSGYSRYRTPVGNLYMCGAATWPGAGTSATSGFQVAKMLAG